MRRGFLAKLAVLLAASLVLSFYMPPIADRALEFAAYPESPDQSSSGAFPGANAESLGAIHLAPGAFEIGVGDEKQLDYMVDGTRCAPGVEWTTSDPEIATVGPGGMVRAVAQGECVLTGVSYGGHTAEARVVVFPAPTVLIVSPASVRLGRGEAYAIAPVISAGSRASFTYRSSNSSVASVDALGVVSAKKNGSAVITASTHNGETDTLRVSVSKPPSGIAFQLERIVAYTGETVKASVKLTGGSASVISYKSSDPGIARVDSTGRVRGVAPGEAVITAATFNGKVAACPVVVYDPPARIEAPELIDLVAGVPAELGVWAETADGERFEGYLDIDIADPDILAVEGGMLYPLKRGDTYITFTAHRVSLRVEVSVSRYGDAYATLVAAHRGGRGNGTENTLAALAGAVAQGADCVEVDVRMTADGVPVLMHDASVNRTSNSYGIVSRLTLAELRAMSFGGAPVCTLEEALQFLSGTGACLLLEIKAPGIEDACVQAVRAYDMADRVTYISFSLNSLIAVRARQPDARIGFLYVAELQNPAAVAKQFGVNLMLPAMGLVDEEYVAALHNAGVEVGAWTVNRTADLRKIHRTGVDIVITDYVISALMAVGR